MVKVQWTEEVWENDIGSSKKAGLMCMTRNEVGACLWSRTIFKKKMNAKIRENRRFTIYDLHEYLPDLSRSVIHEIVRNWRKGSAATFVDERRTKAGPTLWQVP
jgi:hypothetical protein